METIFEHRFQLNTHSFVQLCVFKLLMLVMLILYDFQFRIYKGFDDVVA